MVARLVAVYVNAKFFGPQSQLEFAQQFFLIADHLADAFDPERVEPEGYRGYFVENSRQKRKGEHEREVK
ncbi:hypothetical protein JCM14722_05220 [Pseudodesulfovibrio portus]|uniref:Uncharacterized protein n=1 Tax=Pseudodesulfovibrio portus TaxID=231439 RepID=A0ABM8ANS9_9BACT|nr:hypothetical protein JCM14722_05220 [Pseudodesulfovibrio portus]